MNLVCFGLSHHSASLDLMEAISLDDSARRDVIARLRRAGAAEVVSLATCNRLEFYFTASEVCAGRKALLEAIHDRTGHDLREEKNHFFVLRDADAARHLFRVACGLDSLVVGEKQILGQIRCAVDRAREEDTLGERLPGLFQRALNVGRRVRHETAISRGDVSVASVAVALTANADPDLASKRVLIVGAGETAKAAARSFAGRGVAGLHVVNRTKERAEQLAAEVGGTAAGIDCLMDELRNCDIAVGAARVDHALVSASMVRESMADRVGRPLILIDLGLPRNIDPAADDVEGVSLFSLRDLEEVAAENLAQRRAELPKAEEMVAQEVAKFEAWTSSTDVQELNAALRRRVEEIRQAHLERHAADLPEDQRAQLDRLTDSLMRAVLHDVTLGIRSLNSDGEHGARDLELVRRLFNLSQAARPGNKP